MGIKVANNAVGVLAAGISDSDVTITVQSGQGARFPTLGAGDYFYATLINTSNQLEIVKCTARSADVLTVTRGQESTTARSYDVGDRIEIRITAATFEDATDVVPATVSGKANTATDYFQVPRGTTAQRPASPQAGMMRFNTDEGYIEWYDDVGDRWLATSSFLGVAATGGTVTEITQDGEQYRVHTFTSDGTLDVTRSGEVEYLVVAGGGSGGEGSGGGGGAGGVLTGGKSISASSFPIIVGGGGSDVSTGPGNAGENSTALGETAFGGGGGGSDQSGRTSGEGGGSGGGAARGSSVLGQGTAGQGNDGGIGDSNGAGGGGGGAGQTGFNSSSTAAGGDGISSSITGTLTFYGGGGGASNRSEGDKPRYSNPIPGGLGGGGAGDNRDNAGGSAGVSNTGGGGGGSDTRFLSSRTHSGGSGIVIVRYRIG